VVAVDALAPYQHVIHVEALERQVVVHLEAQSHQTVEFLPNEPLAVETQLVVRLVFEQPLQPGSEHQVLKQL
jgi:hypothetical protein